jgi:transposase
LRAQNGVDQPPIPSSHKSLCKSHQQSILAKLEQGLSARRIYQDLQREHGFSGSYYSVRRYVARLEGNTPLPHRRMETDPGEEAQIDFGTGAVIVGSDGKKRRPWMFRIVLSYSRKAYSEVVYRQTSDNFIAAIENAVHYFGGVPKRLVIDNLKAAVKQADWYDPEIHPKLQSFAAHYGTAFVPTKPYRPEHKGKVESSVKYAKNNGLKGHEFKCLADQNDHLLDWESTVADTRIHGTTKKQVRQQFEAVERAALLPLPRERFALFHEARRTVSRDGHLEVDKAYYSAPPEYVGRRLWARWDARLVRIFNDQWKQVALHSKCEPGRFRTDATHLPAEKISAVERGTDALLRQIATIGPHTKAWSEATIQVRGVEGVRVLVGLKALAGKHQTPALEDACRVALSHGAHRLRSIRNLLKRAATDEQQSLAFIEEHPIIRPLANYSLESLYQFRKDRHYENQSS